MAVDPSQSVPAPTEVERLRSLLDEAATHLEVAADFMEGGPGAKDFVTQVHRLVGAIYYALGKESQLIDGGVLADEEG